MTTVHEVSVSLGTHDFLDHKTCINKMIEGNFLVLL